MGRKKRIYLVLLVYYKGYNNQMEEVRMAWHVEGDMELLCPLGMPLPWHLNVFANSESPCTPLFKCF